MKYFCLPNLAWKDVEVRDVPTLPDRADYPETKAEYRAWCEDQGTKHSFYSLVEGIDPNQRITVENPPFKMYGLVVDYDAQVTDDMVKLIPENGAAGLLPRWISTTYSGNRRVVWEFETPVMVDNEEVTDRFLKLLAKELKVKYILPNPDQTSFKRAQYFEQGRSWQEISGWNVVPTSLLSFLFFKAAGQKQIRGEGPDIPMEKIADEVENRFPGRWIGEFAEGARGPLFWIPDNIDRIGCQVGEYGMLCYSERAGKSFLHWGEIFGQEFVREFQAERIGTASEGIWFDGRYYWLHEEDGHWRAKNKDDTVMWLKCQGINPRPMGKEFASEAEQVLNTVQKIRQVRAAAPVVHDKRESVLINGERFLNISEIKIMQPADTGEVDEFPWLRTFFDNIWADPVAAQRHSFFAWLHHFYANALAGTPAQGQGVFIAGPPSSGKTFLNHKILGEIMGGKSDATNFLMGKTSFNKENSQVALWSIDDTRGAGSWENKSAFASAVKKHIANPEIRCEGKGTNSFTIPWKGRIVVTCNTDKESLEIIPKLNATITDKLMLYWWGNWRANFLPNGGTEAVVRRELPHFLRWLLDWNPPATIINKDNPRYHVQSYHHPLMLKHAYDASPEARLSELLTEWRREFSGATSDADLDEDGCSWMTVTKLRKELSMDPSARDAIKEFNRQRMAEALERLGPEFVRGEREWKGCTEFCVVVKERKAKK